MAAVEADTESADSFQHRIVRLDPKTHVATLFAGTGKAGFGGDGGPAEQAQFNITMCGTLSPDGAFMTIADIGNHRVRRIDLKTRVVTTLAGNGKRGLPKDGDDALQAPMGDVRATCVAKDGTVYALLRGGNALVAIKDGKLNVVVNKAGKAGPATDGPAFDAMVDEINALEDRIKRIETANALQFENNDIDDAAEKLRRTLRDQRGLGDNSRAAGIEAFTKWCRVGNAGLTAEEMGLLRNDLSVGTNGAGGFTVQTDVATFIIDALKDFGGMRRVATPLRTEGGNPLLIPASDGTAEEGAIVAENAAATDLDPVFTQIALPVFMYSSLVVPVSLQLLMDSQIDVEGFVTRRLVNRLGRIQNRHFTVGTGSGQPNGIVTAAAVGKTGTTGQTTTVIYDDLVDLESSVDIEYRRRPDTAFMMSDLALRQVRKIKDTAGLPIFARDPAGAGAPTGAPMTLLGYRIEVNNNMPVMAANAKSIIFGALAEYHIRDVLDVLLQRYDDSAYAKKGQVGFNAWMRSGGNLIDNGGAVKAYQNSAT